MMSTAGHYVGERGLVVTTINPKGCLDHQSRCLQAWRDLGLRVVSFNSKGESATVSDLYGKIADVVELDDEATALSFHGTPAPRIKPVLQLALKQWQPECLFLTNSDIYPSFRKAPLAIFGEYPAYAFTRKEVISIEAGEACHQMYRGGLDVFAFNAVALAQICGYMEEESCAEQMAFGVPGWDYFMGATVARPEVGGVVLDGKRFWHRAHRTTYSQIDPFMVIVPYLLKLGFVHSHDCASAAAEFAAYIAWQCGVNSACASTMELIYGNFNTRRTHPTCPEQLRGVMDIIGDDPAIRPYGGMIGDLDAYMASPQMCIDGLQSYFLKSESPAPRFREYLIMIYLSLLVRGSRERRVISDRYPVGNAHLAAVHHILRDESFYARRCQLAVLFFNEYFIYNILNRSDLKALALACMNDMERHLVKKIILTINHEANY